MMQALLWEQAYDWLCRQRIHAPHNADIWHFRWVWPNIREKLFYRVIDGHYTLSPMLICRGESNKFAMWSACDALVLKWVALNVAHELPRPERCMHLKGKGVRKSIREVAHAVTQKYTFVHRTDIRGYYENIQKIHVISQVERFVSNPVMRSIIKQYINYSVEEGGEVHTPLKGIPRGCALSPMIGAMLLRHIDSYYQTYDPEDLFYVRYMDDFLLFARTRWQHKRAIRELAEFFELSGFVRHPDKTQTGRISAGFDWLGIWFGPDGTSISPRALTNHQERRLQLLEQARRRGMTTAETRLRVQAYENRWKNWANGLLKASVSPCED
ncbi:transposase [Salmonella enterica subsp. enterica]|nr:transposase [Salmonella enterica subsp. enterica serovar Bonn]EBZ5939336.1 transposase [Salmonella enterica subsp. enterica serovar Muenchen]MLZ41079.1 transposase [Salmonella enterica subsp. enterica serovar Bonn]